ncbi:hypothetical protein D3C84_618170 [compost metagenome]
MSRLTALARGVEHKGEPALGFFVLLFFVQPVSHKPRQIQEQFEEVQVVSPREIHRLCAEPIGNGRFFHVLGIPAQQGLHTAFCTLDQMPDKRGVHANWRPYYLPTHEFTALDA